MTVLIVLIVIVGRVLQSRYRAHGRIAETQPVESADTMRMREEMRAMKDRIQVLERVITDNHGSLDLDRQIERLRDQ
ncbi:hypothetical protein [Sphingomonas bacterium]|uniref:hypothetical protein n=1 Tax=Sphingomonas bacterium TaxID=1895847 RepID=UPI0015762824|nr:hypothetical protein [Sphingomonas bacterium]